MKKEVTKIFNDLDDYRDFCREEGFSFNEADLYKPGSYWGLYDRRNRNGLVIDNQWEKGARIFKRSIHLPRKK